MQNAVEPTRARDSRPHGKKRTTSKHQPLSLDSHTRTPSRAQPLQTPNPRPSPPPPPPPAFCPGSRARGPRRIGGSRRSGCKSPCRGSATPRDLQPWRSSRSTARSLAAYGKEKLPEASQTTVLGGVGWSGVEWGWGGVGWGDKCPDHQAGLGFGYVDPRAKSTSRVGIRDSSSLTPNG